MTVTYNYLGYGVTDNQGKAKLEYDAQGNPLTHSYTGTGAGEIDIVASLDDNTHISDSSLVSETFVLWDTFFYDGGVTGNSNINNWDNYNSRYSINVQSDGTLLTNTNASLYAYLIANNPNVPSGSGSSSFEFNYPLAIELDIVDANDINKNGFNFEKSSDNRFAFGEFYASIGDHLKVVYDGATLKSYLNNSSTVSKTIEFSELSDFRLSFYSQVNSYLKFKNFKVYPI